PVSHHLLHDPPPAALCPPSLHDALPIYQPRHAHQAQDHHVGAERPVLVGDIEKVALGRVTGMVDHRIDTAIGRHRQIENTLDILDRKSTRLNSSHVKISYAVFCLKRKI